MQIREVQKKIKALKIWMSDHQPNQNERKSKFVSYVLKLIIGNNCNFFYKKTVFFLVE